MDDHDLYLVNRDALGPRHDEVAHSRIAFDRGDGDGYTSAALHRLRFLRESLDYMLPYRDIIIH